VFAPVVTDEEKSFVSLTSVVTLSLSLLAGKNKLECLLTGESVTKKSFKTTAYIVTLLSAF
jgi:hypothetical protein